MKTRPPTRAEYEEWLNELGTPEDDKKSNGGRIPDDSNYGAWTRRHDPVAFNVGFNEFSLNPSNHIRES
jgi:hypothetical protein